MKRGFYVVRLRILVFFIWNISCLLLTGCAGQEPVLKENESYVSTTEDVVEEETLIDNSEKDVEERECYVHICGAVNHPGVYKMSSTYRIYQAVALAGGFREDACTDYLNQAMLVKDGEQIRILTEEEAAEEKKNQVMQKTDTGTEGTLININTADEGLLCTLPGIGSLKAAGIIAFREENGGFSSIEEIQQVDGIKGGTYQKIKTMITV